MRRVMKRLKPVRRLPTDARHARRPPGPSPGGGLREDEGLYTGKVDGQPVQAIPVCRRPYRHPARTGALHDLLHAVSRAVGRRQRHGGAAWTAASREFSSGPVAGGAHRVLLRCDHQWLWCDAGLRRTGTGARPLVDCRLRARAAGTARTLRSTTCRRSVAQNSTRARVQRLGNLRRLRESVATETYQAPETVGSLQRLGMGVALLGVVGTIVGFLMYGQERFFQAYLVAYTFVFGIVLGSMALLMVQHLSGGAWGIVIRRPLEAAVRTMPIMALLYLPIAFGVHDLYHWAHPDVVSGDAVLQQKAPYLNIDVLLYSPGRLFRGLARDWLDVDVMVRRARPLRQSGARPQVLGVVRRRPRHLQPHGHVCDGGLDDVGQPALVLDRCGDRCIWSGQGLSAMAFVITIADHAVADRAAPPHRDVAPSTRSAGSSLFAFLMLHAYLSFSQFLIIWSANLVGRDSALPRSAGTAAISTSSIFMIVGHFAVPYALLLSRDIKRSFTAAAGDRDVASVCAPGRLLLARRAGVPQGIA